MDVKSLLYLNTIFKSSTVLRCYCMPCENELAILRVLIHLRYNHVFHPGWFANHSA